MPYSQRDAGGAIEIASEVGRGTVVSVYLPAAAADEQQEPHVEATELSAWSLRVLFVDDETSLARIGTRTLRRLGHAVTTHTGSVSALADFRSRPDDFDVVVTDYTMPHLTGLELAREILRIRPGLPLILVSGHTDALPLDNGVQFQQVLMKPVTTLMYEEALAPLLRARAVHN